MNGLSLRTTGVTNTGARMYRLDGDQAPRDFLRGLFSFRIRNDSRYPAMKRFRKPSGVAKRSPETTGFDLGSGHPFHPQFQGFIRAKFKTPMLGEHLLRNY
ncbi:hypothetical protein GQ600_27823 [Phytophthora cactorum]|nr:hypothetical protein GQ600_27823 [Phytophthora cactorum]